MEITFKDLVNDSNVIRKMMGFEELIDYYENYYDVQHMRDLVDIIDFINKEKGVIVPLLVVMETMSWFLVSRLDCSSCYDAMIERKEDYMHQLEHYLRGAKECLDKKQSFNPDDYENWLSNK